MFPKLETIEQMQLSLIEAVVQAQKGHALKSLRSCCIVYDWELGQNGGIDATAFEKMAQLQPKLTCFELPASTYFVETNEFRLMKTSVSTILHSSAQSLESLIITPTAFYGNLNIPKMTALKSLEFSDVDEVLSIERDLEFFPPDVSPQEMFPNARNFSITLKWGNSELNDNWVNRYLPATLFSLWGFQVKQLKLPTVRPDVLPSLQRLFPNIEKLELRLLGDSSSKVADIMLKLVHLWPDLKSLTIPVGSTPYVLFWEFLGLPEEVMVQVRNETSVANFSDAQIQEFKDRCWISKLKGLKQLRIVLSYFFYKVDPDTGEMVTTAPLATVSDEFGFKLLEGLDVTVDIWRHHSHLQAIKNELKPFTESGNIKIVESIRHERW